MKKTFIETEDGVFTACFSGTGLALLNFPSNLASTVSVDESRQDSSPISIWHRTTAAALRRALRGQAPEAMPPLDLSAGTPFQRNVWEALRKIRASQTMSYGEVARSIGRPKAVRAVGQACGANPIPVLIPCHRVLAAHGGLGGFSGGLHWKTELLGREGVRIKGC